MEKDASQKSSESEQGAWETDGPESRLRIAARREAFSTVFGDVPESPDAAPSLALFRAEETGVEAERGRPRDLGSLEDGGGGGAT